LYGMGASPREGKKEVCRTIFAGLNVLFGFTEGGENSIMLHEGKIRRLEHGEMPLFRRIWKGVRRGRERGSTGGRGAIYAGRN